MTNEKSTKTRAKGVRFPETLITEIEKSSARTKRTFSEWVVKACREKLDK